MPLPPGLLLNHETGELTGVPTVAGTYAIQLKVRDLLGTERELTDSVTINAYTPLSWIGDMGPLMATRAPTAITVTRMGGLGAYTYSIFSGALPAGLSLNTGTGAITGTPTTAGAYAFTLRVVDSLSQSRDIVLAGTVAANLDLSHANATQRGDIGSALTDTATRTGGTAPFTYAITSGTLPGGITMSSSTGTLSGTPTAIFDGAVTVRVTDAFGFTDTSVVTFDINATPAISGGLGRGMVGKAYSQTFTGSGGHTPYVWGVTSPPTSVSINTGSGVLSGTPSVAGTFNTDVSMTDNIGVVKHLAGPLIIAAALNISGTYNTTPTRGVAYPDFTAIVTGGWSPYTFSVSAGSLPAGLSLNSTTGKITGTPTTQANYTATLRVTDADGSFAEMAFNVNVQGDVSMTGGIPALGTVTVAFTGDNLGVSGGLAPYVWSISAGALPTGMALNTSTGDLTGTPSVAGTFNFTVRVTDANGSYAEVADSIVVANMPSLSGDLPDSTNGATYNSILTRSGGHTPFAFDLSAGTLPTGLSINSSTGAITGTPTVNGTSSFTVRVTDTAGNVATRADSITVYAAVALSGNYALESEAANSDGSDPTVYSSNTLTSSGGKSPIVWLLDGGTLPPGLSINAGSGVLSGTTQWVSEASGLGYTDYNFTVRATDALGSTATKSQTFRLYWHVIKGPGGFASATQGVAYSSSKPAVNGKSPYTHVVVGGTLPSGLSLASATGTMTGTPTVSGSFSLTYRYTDALSKFIEWSQTLTVWPAATISGDAPRGTQGVVYGYTYSKGGGNGVYSFQVVAGALPAGLSLNSSTGVLGGTPTGTGTSSFTVRVTSAGSIADVADSIQINAYPSLTLTYGRGMVGKSYSGTASTSNGWTPYSYSLNAGSLPNGTSLNSSTGALSGTPSAIGTFTPTIRVTDADGNIDLKQATIQIASALAFSGTYSAAQQNVAYSSSITVTGGWTPRSFSVVSGAIPAGTTLNSSTGAITGTPTTATTYNFTIRVTDADGSTLDQAYSIVVAASVPFSVSASPNPAVGYGETEQGSPIQVGATSTVTPSGGTAPYTYSWSFLSFSGSTIAPTISNPTLSQIRSLSPSKVSYSRTDNYRCTVTDNTGAVRTVDVSLQLTIESLGNPNL